MTKDELADLCRADSLRLMCGELAPAELRLAQAVARGICAKVQASSGEAVERDAARYRAWRDGDVVVRPLEEGWETRNATDPHWDVGSWFWRKTLDEAIDAALGRSEGE